MPDACSRRLLAVMLVTTRLPVLRSLYEGRGWDGNATPEERPRVGAPA